MSKLAQIHTTNKLSLSLKSVQINLLNKCYQKCIGCRKYEWEDVHIQYFKLLELLTDLQELNCESVVYSGGEPFAYKEFDQLITDTKAANLKVLVLTAGVWPKSLNYDIFNRIDRLSLSFDGATPDSYKHARGVNTFTSVLANLKKVQDYTGKKDYVTINATISQYNLDDMLGIYQLFEEYDIVKSINFYPLHTWKHLSILDKHKDTLPDSVFRSIQNCVDYVAKSKTKKPTNIFQFYSLLYRQKPSACIVPYVHCFIDANGDVLVCCRVANDNGEYNREQGDACGNIINDRLINILRSPEASKYRSRFAQANHSACLECDRYSKLNSDYVEYKMSVKNGVYL